jgi:hypothetical protein
MPNVTTRRQHAGGAVQTTLASGCAATDTSLTITAATGWPDGSVGPFFVVVDRGTSVEEKVLIQSRTSTTLTVATSGRGADGTTAAAHASGALIFPCYAALEADEANAHTAASSGLHGVAGNVVGDSDTQTLTNKTLTSPTVTGTVGGGASYSAPTLTSPSVTGTVGGGASYTAPTLTSATLTSPAVTGTVTGGASYISPTLTTPTVTSPTVTGTVAGGASYTSPTLTSPTLAGNVAVTGNPTFAGAAPVVQPSTAGVAGIELFDTTASQANPIKYVRSAAGQFQVVNSSNSATIFALDDTGALQAGPIARGQAAFTSGGAGGGSFGGSSETVLFNTASFTIDSTRRYKVLATITLYSNTANALVACRLRADSSSGALISAPAYILYPVTGASGQISTVLWGVITPGLLTSGSHTVVVTGAVQVTSANMTLPSNAGFILVEDIGV